MEQENVRYLYGRNVKETMARIRTTLQTCHYRCRVLGVIFCTVGLTGCSTLKQAGIVGTAAGAGALAGTALSGGVAAPILGATTTAFVADAVMGAANSPAAQIIQAPDNVFSVIQRLVEVAGWGLLVVFAAPILLGWLLPGPLERKRAKP